MLWENSIFPNKNSSQVQAKHSLQAHFHLLKSCAHTHAQTLFHLSTGAQSGTVSPGAGLEPSTPDKSSDIAPWPCFQMDHVTHQKKRGKELRGSDGGRERDLKESRMEGWKNKKGVLTVVRVWGWTGREALGGTGVCFCSDD